MSFRSLAFFMLAFKMRPVIFLALAAQLLFACGCQEQPESIANDHVTDQQDNANSVTSDQMSLMSNAHYVDDKLCAECHQEIYDSYQHVGMGKSFYDFDTANQIEQFENAHYYHEASDNHYEIAIVDGKLQQTRYKLKQDGSRTHEHSVSAKYVVGSGNHVRTYLSRNNTGEMFQLPVVWYTQDKKWGMAPGYDEATHPDFSRPITRQCMACHNAYPELEPGADAFGMPHRFPEKLPQGVGCQRCHGPGSEHVRISNFADVDDTDEYEQVLNSIVNSGKLSPELQDDVCNQCHLQPMSRRTSVVRLFGKGDFEFIPGQSLNEHIAHFEPAHDKQTVDEFEINHHPYRLHQSKCFSQTPGGIRCTHCHDPHQKVQPDERPAFYREKCFACHDSQDCLDQEQGRAPDANCIACHMPERRTEDVIHVTMTDHKIVRRPSLADPKAPLAERTIPVDAPVSDFHWNGKSNGNSKTPESSTLIKLFSQILDDDENSIAAFANEVKTRRPQHVAPQIMLLQKLVQYRKYDEAYEVFRSLDPAAAKMPINLTNAGIAALGRKDYELALSHLEAATAADPDNPEAWYNTGVAHSRIGQTDKAITSWQKSIRARPSYVKPRLKIGSQLALDDQLEDAKVQFETALEIDTRNLEAYRKLSSIMRLQGDWPQAVGLLKDSLKISPANIDLLTSLLLALLEPGNRTSRDKALSLGTAERLRSLAPKDPDNLLLLALAHLENQQSEAALEFISDALKTPERKPEAGLLLAIAQQISGAEETAKNNFAGASNALSQRGQSDRLTRVIRQYAESHFKQSDRAN